MTDLRPFSFVHSARRVIYGPGSIAELKGLAGGEGAALILDQVFAGGPLEARLREILGDGVHVHPIPRSEPDTATAEGVRDFLLAHPSGMIVAVGGGSAMDAAKVGRMLLSNPGPAEAIDGFGKTLAPHPSLFVAVPTTAGTGSEVSESAILSKPGAAVKLIYRSQDMTPRVAILDPETNLSAPPVVTAQSGYDAVTHAVEAYVSNFASPMTDPVAVAAMEALARWLPVAYREPGNIEARGQCLIASCQAAVAFNSANLGLAHALSAPLGALHHVGHGLGNALALPAVTAYNEPVLGAKGEVVARIFGAATPSAGLARLRAELDLDLGLDDFVKNDADREALAQAAMRSGQVRMNPRLATVEHMRAIIAAMRKPIGTQRPGLAL